MAGAIRAGTYANAGAGWTGWAQSTAHTVQLGAAASDGDCLVAHIFVAASGDTSATPTVTVSDTVNSTTGWFEAQSLAQNTTNGGLHALWLRPNSGAGQATISVTIASAPAVCFGGFEVAAFSGVSTDSNPVDAIASALQTSSPMDSGATTTTTTAVDELMIGAWADFGYGTTLTQGNVAGVAANLAGKHDGDGGNWQALLEYGDSGASGGTPHATATSSSSATGALIAVVLKLTGGGPSTVTKTATPVTSALSGTRTRTSTPVTATLSTVAQTAVPVSLEANPGGWTDHNGSSVAADLVAAIATAGDGAYIQSPATPVNASITFHLGTLSTPAAGTRLVKGDWYKDVSGGTIDYTINVRNHAPGGGGTLIQSFSGGSLSNVDETASEIDLTETSDPASWGAIDIEIVANQSA